MLLLTGPRQVGKTTLLELCAGDHASAGRRYVTLDDLDARSLACEDPALFLQRWPPPLIIDEIQYAPQLFSAIKVIVDREKRNGMFWMTGSQKFHLMRGITESLAGRVAVLDLLGLSRAELAGRSASSRPFVPTPDWIARSREAGTMPLMDLYREIWIGSFPRVHEHGPDVRDQFYRSYIQTYIQRDVQDLLRISDQMAFHRFLVSVAARTGQLLNYAALSRDTGIDNKTARAWLSVLEASGLVYLLQPYHTNLTKRLVRAPKLYFLDTGLASYLTRWPDPASLEAGNMSGAILETRVVAEVIKSYWHQGRAWNAASISILTMTRTKSICSSSRATRSSPLKSKRPHRRGRRSVRSLAYWTGSAALSARGRFCAWLNGMFLSPRPLRPSPSGICESRFRRTEGYGRRFVSCGLNVFFLL